MYKGDVSDENEEQLFSLEDINYAYRGKFHVNRKPPLSASVTHEEMLQYAERMFQEASDTKRVYQKKPQHSSSIFNYIYENTYKQTIWGPT